MSFRNVITAVLTVAFLTVAASGADGTANLKYLYAGEWGGPPSGWAIRSLLDMAVGPDGNLHVLYSGDDLKTYVQTFDRAGKSLGRWGGEGSGVGRIEFGGAVAVGPSGAAYVVGFGADYAVSHAPGAERAVAWKCERWREIQSLSDVAAAPDGTVYVVDENGRVDRFSPAGEHLGEWLPRDAAGEPLRVQQLAVGADGRRYVAAGERSVWRFDADGLHAEEITRGEGLGSIFNLGVGADGAVAVSDGHQVRVYEPDGTVRAAWQINSGRSGNEAGYADMVTALAQANPAGVDGLAFGADGTVYVANADNDVIYLFSDKGKQLGKLDASSPPLTTFNDPQGIAASPAGDVYVADSFNGRVVHFSAAGEPLGAWGRDLGCYDRPEDVAWTPEGDVAVLYGESVVRVFAPAGEVRGAWLVRGSNTALAVAPDGSVYFVYRSPEPGVRRLDPDGRVMEWKRKGTRPGRNESYTPDVAVGPDGTVYVADDGFGDVQLFSPQGKFRAAWRPEGETPYFAPRAVVVSAAGDVFAASDDMIFRFDRDGRVAEKWPVPAGPGGRDVRLYGIAVGPDGTVYAVDNENDRVLLFRRGTPPPAWEPEGGVRYHWTDDK